MQNSQSKKALALIFLGVLLLGTGPMFVKYVHANGVLVGFYRLFFAAAMLSLPAIFLKPKTEKILPSGKGLKWGILGGLVLALNLSLWCTALNYTTASAVTLLDNTAPVWVGLLGWLLLGERQSGRFWLGLLVTIGGAGLMIGWDVFYGSSTQTTGNLIGIASGISYAIYVLITKEARNHMTSLRYTWIETISGTIGLLLVALLAGLFKQPMPGKSLFLIFLMSLTSQVIGYLLINHAVEKLPAAAVSVALVGQPVVTTLLGIVILKEIPSLLQLVGALICLIGIIVVQRSMAGEAVTIVTE
jgi:drug/metabolite transporter (DMT)-like permease